MLHPSTPLPRMSTAITVQSQLRLRVTVRNLLHLITVVSLALSTLTPVLTPPQVALADVRDTVDLGRRYLGSFRGVCPTCPLSHWHGTGHTCVGRGCGI